MEDWYLIVSAFDICNGLVTHAMGLHGKQQNEPVCPPITPSHLSLIKKIIHCCGA
jgi:hypothetical protein